MADSDVAAALEEGLRLCQAGAMEQAQAHYRSLVASHPDAPDAWNMLAVVLYQRGDLAGAGRAATSATELRPHIAPYWLMRGNIELARRLHPAAQESLSRAIALQPGFAEAHYRLGLSYMGEARFADAAAAFQGALKAAPQVAEIHWQLAEALLAQGRFEDAMRAYQQAYVRDPEWVLDRRNCFDCMGRLQFDALPVFWHAEIERFFQRDDVDLAHYVGAGLKALKTKPYVRETLRAADGLDTPALRQTLEDPFLHALLRAGLIADRDLERLLTRVRSRLLLDSDTRADTSVGFLSALALQCFNNEYAHAQSNAEAGPLAQAQTAIEDALDKGTALDDASARELLVYAAYRPLHSLRGADRLLSMAPRDSPLHVLLQRSVADVREERELRTQIGTIGAISDGVSQAVRGMYEENPYPRWFAIDRAPPITLSEWLQREVPAIPVIETPPAVRVLVAGCGTGHDALWLASNIAGASVLAVDLSLTSLSYAQRMANTLVATNVEFRHGDILGLADLPERFDMVASTGVLHHMLDPLAGLKSIAGLLRPGGLMKLGLYSRRARHSVNAARQLIAARQIPPTEAAIRSFRQTVLDAAPDSPLGELRYSNDFYSTSMCRDLLFHIQEHQYDMLQISELLRDAGLNFLGLSELPQETIDRYRRMFPNDTFMKSVGNWDRYEEQYPNTFSGMFLFWCRKPES